MSKTCEELEAALSSLREYTGGIEQGQAFLEQKLQDMELLNIKLNLALFHRENSITHPCQQVKDLVWVANQTAALLAIWEFIKDEFPKGTGEDHGTCANDEYMVAVRKVEAAVKDIT